MNLDVNTLFMVTIYVEAILGLLLLFAWVQNTSIKAVAWWGFAHLLRAASVVLFGMYGNVPDLISIDLANAMLFTAFAVTWTGARVFDGRPAEPVYMVTGAVLWLLICRLPILNEAVDARVLIASGIITGYTWLTAFEFWRGRDEQLVSRWPAIFMLFAHGALFLLRTPLVAVLPWSVTNQVYGSVWLTVLSFEALLFTISIAFILACHGQGAHRVAPPHRGHGRSADRHRQPPFVPAGGGADRQAPHRRSAADRRPGHRSRPLQVDQRPLRPRPRRPRAGNLQRDRAPVDALDRPDRPARRRGIRRRALRHQPRQGDGRGRAHPRKFRAGLARKSTAARSARTVSIGMVHCQEAVLDVPQLLAQADQALYYAKERGRNRVEVASLDLVMQQKDGQPAPSGAASAKTAA